MEGNEDSSVVGNASITREEIEARVKDWLQRLENLFTSVQNWATMRDWTVTDVGTVVMNEELMHKFDVQARELPTLKIDGKAGAYALLKPKALWVIGANGRIDLYTSKGTYIIVDKAPRFDVPDWRIFRADTKGEGRSFDPSLLEELV